MCLHTIQLRSAVGDIPVLVDKDDHFFLRWLRGRKFNLREAEDMLRKVSECL